MWVVAGRSGVLILYQVIREGLPKWITFEQRPVGVEGVSMQLFRERAFQKEGLAIAKGVRQELAWHVEEETRRPVWLEKREQMAERLDMGNKS